MKSQYELIIAKKYARAFMNVFHQKLDFNEIENLEKLVQVIDRSKKALFYMELTILESDIRKEAFTKLFDKFNINKVFENLIDLLIRDKRLSLLVSILNYIIEIYFEKSNILKFNIVSSKKLPDNYLANILVYLEKQTGKKIIYKTEIDKNLIAGIKLYSKTLGFEYSINKQLRAIRQLY